MKDSPARRVFVVSHTHWDREWYKPYQEFRAALIVVLKQVLDLLENDRAFRHFHLDGQSILVEDFLEIAGDEEERIGRFIREGKLSVGPWYVLADEFLVSGESLVRNLMFGRSVQQRFGARAQSVMYVPDAFGHVQQLPQIAAQAGMDTIVFSRGAGDELEDLGAEFIWRAPNGSKVTAVHQWGGYCRGGALGFRSDEEATAGIEMDISLAVSQVEMILTELAEHSNGDVHLLSNGCDHLPPQARLGDLLQELEAVFPGVEFIHGSLESFAAGVRVSGAVQKEYSGELRGSRYQFVLPGVLSARHYLKRKNHDAQLLLNFYLEPLAVMLWVSGVAEYPKSVLSKAWRLLLENHPHDSICGCSIDEVHRDMLARFSGVEQLCRTEITGLLRSVISKPVRGVSAKIGFALVNTLPFSRSVVTERLLVLPGSPNPDEVTILDASGNVIPSEVVDFVVLPVRWGTDVMSAALTEDQRAGFEVVREMSKAPASHGSEEVETVVLVKFTMSDLPPTSCSFLQVKLNEEAKSGPPPRTVQVDTEANSIENRFVRVDLRGDGSFDLLDKISGGRYEGLNVLEDVPDTGDEYNHASLEPCEPTVSSGVDGSVSVVEQTAFAATLRAQCEIELPISLTDDRKSRSDVSVTCALKMDVSLEADSPLVKIRLLFDNRASDHRLRVRFPTDVTADTVLSDGCFFVDRRPTKVLDRPDWTELPCDSYPQQEFSAVTDGVTGLAVFQKGLHEVAPLVTERGTGVAVTLLRAVGWLSRYDVPARKNRPAGPMLPTPEAQCLGVQRFDYAVMPFQGDVVEGELKRWSALYRVDPLSLQGTFGECDLHGILAVDSADIVVTAIKRHESRESIVVRLCSLVETPTSATVEVGFQVENVWSLDLFENRLHRLHTARHSFDVILGAHEIVSLEITLR